jgi:DNA-binding response OmpR family regulator
MATANDTFTMSPACREDAASPRPTTVLCVDDDPNVSEAIDRRLSRHGVRVLRAFHGMQGYWQAVTEKPDLIILDLLMPKGRGMEIMECLKRNEQTKRIPVAILTGKNDPRLKRTMYELGAVRYFVKPTPIDELLEELAPYIAVPT